MGTVYVIWMNKEEILEAEGLNMDENSTEKVGLGSGLKKATYVF